MYLSFLNGFEYNESVHLNEIPQKMRGDVLFLWRIVRADKSREPGTQTDGFASGGQSTRIALIFAVSPHKYSKRRSAQTLKKTI
jgi:hypothetical protein